ncbi:MAG: LysR family transcriptional regulator [Myxococcales bacterium]|nr:LysR family transcriptional regulator [Myxococcales bacterium]
MPTLEDLRIFTAVAEQGSLGAVARSIGRSQPAVAEHVKRLEVELAVELVVRGSRGVDLTHAGEILYEHASAALASLRTGVAEIERARDRTEGTLALSASAGTTRHYLRYGIEELRRRRPGVEFRLDHGSTDAARLAAIRAGQADLAFISLHAETPGFEQRPVIAMPFVLVVHRDDPLASRKRIDLSAFPDLAYVSLGEESSTYQFLHSQMAKCGLVVSPSHTVADAETALLYTELGLGQTLAPAVQARSLEKTEALRILSIRGLPAMPLGWAARSFRRLPSVAAEFIEIFDQQLGRWRDVPGVRIPKRRQER